MPESFLVAPSNVNVTCRIPTPSSRALKANRHSGLKVKFAFSKGENIQERLKSFHAENNIPVCFQESLQAALHVLFQEEAEATLCKLTEGAENNRNRRTTTASTDSGSRRDNVFNHQQSRSDMNNSGADLKDNQDPIHENVHQSNGNGIEQHSAQGSITVDEQTQADERAARIVAGVWKQIYQNTRDLHSELELDPKSSRSRQLAHVLVNKGRGRTGSKGIEEEGGAGRRKWSKTDENAQEIKDFVDPQKFYVAYNGILKAGGWMGHQARKTMLELERSCALKLSQLFLQMDNALASLHAQHSLEMEQVCLEDLNGADLMSALGTDSRSTDGQLVGTSVTVGQAEVEGRDQNGPQLSPISRGTSGDQTDKIANLVNMHVQADKALQEDWVERIEQIKSNQYSTYRQLVLRLYENLVESTSSSFSSPFTPAPTDQASPAVPKEEGSNFSSSASSSSSSSASASSSSSSTSDGMYIDNNGRAASSSRRPSNASSTTHASLADRTSDGGLDEKRSENGFQNLSYGDVGEEEKLGIVDSNRFELMVRQVWLGAQRKSSFIVSLSLGDVVDECQVQFDQENYDKRLAHAHSLYSDALNAFVLAQDVGDGSIRDLGRVGSSLKVQQFVQICSRSTEFHFPPLPQQINRLADIAEQTGRQMKPGDVFVTRHSNLDNFHVAFHLIIRNATRKHRMGHDAADNPVTGSQQHQASGSDDSQSMVIAGLKRIISSANQAGVRCLTIPLVFSDKHILSVTSKSRNPPASTVNRIAANLHAVKAALTSICGGVWDNRTLKHVRFTLPCSLDDALNDQDADRHTQLNRLRRSLPIVARCEALFGEIFQSPLEDDASIFTNNINLI